MRHNIAALYCRLSTEDEAKLKKGDDSESIRNQKMLLTDYAERHGFTVYKVYADEDFSGLSNTRPAFNEMLRHAEEGRFDTVICKTQSRFTRDMELVEKYIHNKFPLWGIRFLTVVDQADSSLKGNKKARQIYGLINEWYCEDLSDNIRAVLHSKMKNGQFIGSFACYGYVKDPFDRHKLVPDLAAKKVVQEIFSLYLGGKSCTAIADILSERGIKTPTEYKAEFGNYKNPISTRDRGFFGKNFSPPWSSGTIRKILQNETYLGHMVQGKEAKQSYKSKKVAATPKENWVTVKNTHEAIVDAESFYQVQMLLLGHRKSSGKSLNISNALDGKLFCADCGARLQRGSVTRDKKSYYLRCGAYHRSRKSFCTKHSLRLDVCVLAVKEQLNMRVEKFLQDKENVQMLYEHLQSFEKPNENEAENKKIINEQNKIIRTLYLDKAKGIISEEEFIDIKKSCLARIKECESRQRKEQDLSDISVQELTELSVIHLLTPSIANTCIERVEISEKSGEQYIILKYASKTDL